MPTSRHNELIQERADLRTEAAALFAGAGGRLTEAQRSRDDEIEASLTELDAEIEREERNRDRANATAAVAGVQGRRSGLIESIHDRREDEPWGARTGHAFGEFLQAVKNVSMNPVMRADEPRLKWEAALGAGEAGGADGGFLTTVDVAQGILERMYEVGQILGLVKHIPLSGTNNALELNAIDETSRATGSRFGGVQGYWTDEGGSVTATRPKFRKISLKLKKLAALGYATDELLGDAGALESVMNDDVRSGVDIFGGGRDLRGNRRRPAAGHPERAGYCQRCQRDWAGGCDDPEGKHRQDVVAHVRAQPCERCLAGEPGR